MRSQTVCSPSVNQLSIWTTLHCLRNYQETHLQILTVEGEYLNQCGQQYRADMSTYISVYLYLYIHTCIRAA